MTNMRRILVLPGDGIGREVVPVAVRALEALELPLEFIQANVGFGCFERLGTALSEETAQLARTCDAILFGAVSSPLTRVAGYRSPILELRQALDLFVNVRPVRSLPGTTPHVNLTVLRENTEGLYSGLEERLSEDEARTTRIVTRLASERLARFAVQYARSSGQRTITVVHKANVLRETCGLFREACFKTLRAHPGLEVGERLVDAAAYELVRNPSSFELIVTTNLFGDILSDVAAHWCGGLGMAASANVGPVHALFEPVHGSAPDLAGCGLANPLATVEAAAMLVSHLGHESAAQALRSACEAVLKRGNVTPDLGGTATTDVVEKALLQHLSEVRTPTT